MLLGNLYWHGWSVKKDYSKAILFLRKAARQNQPEAQFLLGLSYEYGKGVKRDMDSAIYWYRRSSKQGSKPARNKLSDIYRGLHYKKDISSIGKSTVKP